MGVRTDAEAGGGKSVVAAQARLTHISHEAFGLAICLGRVDDVAFVLLKHLYEFLAGFLGVKGAPWGDHCTTEGGLDAGAGHGGSGG